MPKSVYKSAKAQIKAQYKVDREACNARVDNAKDVCVETAKWREKVALAHLEYQRTGETEDRVKWAEARAESRYEIAKEKCDDKSGNDKDVCNAEAKAAYEKRQAAIKANRDIEEAVDEAEEKTLAADFKVAKERCDARKGDAKDACVAMARARYGK
jgi:hypothetical protein